MFQVRQMGLYVGAFGDPKFDFHNFNDKLEKFNGQNHHVQSPWNNLGQYFLKFNSITKKFMAKVWNEDWFDAFHNCLEQAGARATAENPQMVELCLFDSYQDLKWLKKVGYTFKYVPFRDNDVKVNLTAMGTENSPLFKNWNKQLPVTNPKNFAWMQWIDENDFSTYKPTNAIGEAIMGWIQRIATMTKQALTAHKYLYVRVRTANEPFAVTLEDGKTLDPPRCKEIDGRTEMYVKHCFVSAGCMYPRFAMVYEPTTFVNGSREYPGGLSAFWMSKNYKYCSTHRAYMETHGMDSVADISGMQNIIGTDLAFFIGSSDGSPEDNTYHTRMKGVAKLKLPNFCYKLWASYGKPGDWSLSDMNYNVNKYVPMMQPILS